MQKLRFLDRARNWLWNFFMRNFYGKIFRLLFQVFENSKICRHFHLKTSQLASCCILHGSDGADSFKNVLIKLFFIYLHPYVFKNCLFMINDFFLFPFSSVIQFYTHLQDHQQFCWFFVICCWGKVILMIIGTGIKGKLD